MLPIISTKRIKTQKKNNMQKDEAVVTCDLLFKEYRQRLDDTQSTPDDISSCYEKYRWSRDLLNATVLKQHENEYFHIVNMNDDNKLWQKIDWGGNLKTTVSNNHPDILDLANHFETLYQPLPDEDVEELSKLTSNVYIPANDDIIPEHELKIVAASMKKGGWDYSISVLKLLMRCIPTCMLYAIPKKGNLLLP